jgi:saccharopine dehydrogenase (NAD+, L-lysine forming)
MGRSTRLWLRAELRGSERRAPVVPEDAGRLVAAGIEVTVEESADRVFPSSAYAAVGCRIAASGSWPNADRDHVVIGLKELPPAPRALVHRHVYFGHAYKGQRGSAELLGRFAAGGGALLDLEYLVGDDGRRLAAFGYWAGYVGAALAVLRWRGQLPTPLRPTTRPALDAALSTPASEDASPRVLVVGALGRSGRGARDALAVAGVTPTCWDLEETVVLDRRTLLDHDILVNAVLATRPGTPFLLPEHVSHPNGRLALVSDVTCDVGSPCNMLPIYDEVTDWDRPVRRLRNGQAPLDLIAIDNLPSLLPAESSATFSAELTPYLPALPDEGPWRRCLDRFYAASRLSGVGTDSDTG